MLTSLRIQNFRSIRDASVKLGQVNLFIGPNNSGKSNFLKGVELSADLIKNYPENKDFPLKSFEAYVYRPVPSRRRLRSHNEDEFIKITLESTVYRRPKNVIATTALSNVEELPFETPRIGVAINATGMNNEAVAIYTVGGEMNGLVIYKPDPSRFQSGVAITNETTVAADGSNIVAFLFYLSQNHKSEFRSLEKDLAKCVGNLVSISTPADPNESGKLKLKFFDNEDRSYWAEEVSEGVLYFLALLCIVHQPDPPKLLLLEEPEKGIHPRRIREVMDFIFELARLRGIQIILTSHSPYVVDYFADIPACISVFDRDKESGETVIHNAGDIIKETNDKLKAAGEEEIHYSDALGEYWVSGFLGGVPEA